LGAWVGAGIDAVAGMFLGLLAGAFGAYVLYAVVKLMKDASHMSKFGIFMLIMAFLIKFPLIGMTAYLSYRRGIDALWAFVVAVVVVYFAMVWRASRADLY
jgi:ABC-type dipeptide/oligopeptide/nickel transport system permease subunit